MGKRLVIVEIENHSDSQLLEVLRRLEHMGLESESDQKHDLSFGDGPTVVVRGLMRGEALPNVRNYLYVVNVWAHPDKVEF